VLKQSMKAKHKVSARNHPSYMWCRPIPVLSIWGSIRPDLVSMRFLLARQVLETCQSFSDQTDGL
jgi:hypothetical protein